MSNDLVLSDIKNALGNLVGSGVDDQTKAVAGAGRSIKRISIKGGVFRKYQAGKEIASIPDRHMDVIFVNMAPRPARMFYPEAYVEGQKISPTCWSNDSDVPDPSIPNPQAESCRKCPQSVKGSGRDGATTACRISWRTAVVLPNDPSGDVMQLVIPGKSAFGEEFEGKRPFQPYVAYLASNGISAGHVVTRMQFDLRHSSPTLLFSPIAAIPLGQLEVLKQQGQTREADMSVKITTYHADAGGVLVEADDAPEVAAPVLAVAPPAGSPPPAAVVSAPVAATPLISTANPVAAVPEPVLRGGDSAAPVMADAVIPDIIKKWAKK